MYIIRIPSSVEKEIRKLPPSIYCKIDDKIEQLKNEPRPIGCKQLKQYPGYRIRVGDYRIVYEVNDKEKTITIFSVGHRRDIYR